MSESDLPQLDPEESARRLQELAARTTAISADSDAASNLSALDDEVMAAGLAFPHFISALFTVSSVTINVGTDLNDSGLISAGINRAIPLLMTAETYPSFAAQVLLNIANGNAALFRLEANEEADELDRSLVETDARFGNDSLIVAARASWKLVSDPALGAPDSDRSRALCNLANELDNAGRWVEAYAAYADALEADPANGNAAGNRAQLLLHRLRTSPQQAGHIEAVYDQWARRAKELRAETVLIAGERAARLWDELPLSDEPILGHLTHVGDQNSPYQQWIVSHRLALAPTVEGLGGDGGRWDSADILQAVNDNDEGSPPRIFAAMNVLKAEFIVARRLAFRGAEMTFTTDGSQHPDDTGDYGAIGDGAVYGEGPASLLLAQRSALDLLDKIAVTANEHFKSGMDPERVSFAKYWRDPKTHEMRPAVSTVSGRRARLALAEVQRDLASDALYPTARLLRNAGTHRLVHGTLNEPTGPTKETFSTVDLIDLQRSTIEALWVARASYLYLVDLIDAETPKIEGDFAPLVSQE